MINVVDLNEPHHEVEKADSWNREAVPARFMPDNSKSRAFGNQIRRYIQATQRTRVQRERYHGKLDKGAIVKLALPPIDGGEYNKRIFYNFTAQKNLNTCIHVLTDWSGSMQGTKMEHAADASGRLVHVFDRVLRVPVQLAAFTNSKSQCDIGLIKRFNDRSMSPKNIAENFSKFYKYSCANNDADAVMWAYRELLKRSEERKILIVLSDGCPAGCWKGSSHTNLKHVTEYITKGKQVELYGVGIESSAVTTYYPNAKVLHDSNDINQTLFEIIKEGVK
jgi:cobaltochelatase CobT